MPVSYNGLCFFTAINLRENPRVLLSWFFMLGFLGGGSAEWTLGENSFSQSAGLHRCHHKESRKERSPARCLAKAESDSSTQRLPQTSELRILVLSLKWVALS